MLVISDLTTTKRLQEKAFLPTFLENHGSLTFTSHGYTFVSNENNSSDQQIQWSGKTYKQSYVRFPIQHDRDLPGESTSIVIHQEKSESDTVLKKTAFLLVKDIRPDYLSTVGDCTYQILQLQSSSFNNFEVFVPVGEYTTIFRIPDEVDEYILEVRNKPFGIQYDTKRIFGRLISLKEHQLIVKLVSGKILKLTLRPYLTEFLEEAFE